MTIAGPSPTPRTAHVLTREALRTLIAAIEQRDLLPPDALACAAQQARHVLTLEGRPSELELEYRLIADLAGLACALADLLQAVLKGADLDTAAAWELVEAVDRLRMMATVAGRSN